MEIARCVARPRTRENYVEVWLATNVHRPRKSSATGLARSSSAHSCDLCLGVARCRSQMSAPHSATGTQGLRRAGRSIRLLRPRVAPPEGFPGRVIPAVTGDRRLAACRRPVSIPCHVRGVAARVWLWRSGLLVKPSEQQRDDVERQRDAASTGAGRPGGTRAQGSSGAAAHAGAHCAEAHQATCALRALVSPLGRPGGACQEFCVRGIA